MKKELVSVKKFAELCGVSDQAIRKRIDKGSLTTVGSPMMIDRNSYQWLIDYHLNK